MFTNYPDPTPQQTETVKKLYEFENQVISSASIEELHKIVENIINSIKDVPTAEIHMQDGRVLNSDKPRQYFIEVLKGDVKTNYSFEDMKVALILTIDLLVGVFILDRRKRPI